MFAPDVQDECMSAGASTWRAGKRGRDAFISLPSHVHVEFYATTVCTSRPIFPQSLGWLMGHELDKRALCHIILTFLEILVQTPKRHRRGGARLTSSL